MEIVIPSSQFTRIISCQAPRGRNDKSPSSVEAGNQISKERTSQWKNTPSFNRLLKDKERLELELEKERVQREIDEIEAAYQANKNRDLIQRANAMISQESERMRVFNSAMMLSDVLAERDNQIKIKEELDRLNRIRELKYDEMGKHNHERMLQREEAEHKERLHKKLEVARVQREQLTDAVAKRRSEIESNKREGFLMGMEYQKQLQDDALDATASKDREIRAMRECQRAQEYLKELKVREKNAASRLDQKIQEHAQKQDEIQLKRKQREKFVFEQKQKIRQDMIDRQATRLAEIRDQADERIQQQCKDALQMQDRIEFERKEYFNERLRDVQDDRRKAIQRKEQHVIAEISREKEATEYMKLLQAKFEEEDASVNMTRQRVENQTREYLLSQIREKQEKHESEAARVSKTRETGAKIEKAQYDEFQDYAEAVIRDYAECGRNVMTMMNVLKGSNPQ